MKTRLNALLITFFLGAVGGHHFYLGDKVKGILSLLLCWTFIPALMALVTFIKLLIMSDEEFNKRYNGSKESKPASKSALTKKPENFGDVLKGLKATWDDPESRKKILRKAFFKNLGE